MRRSLKHKRLDPRPGVMACVRSGHAADASLPTYLVYHRDGKRTFHETFAEAACQYAIGSRGAP